MSEDQDSTSTPYTSSDSGAFGPTAPYSLTPIRSHRCMLILRQDDSCQPFDRRSLSDLSLILSEHADKFRAVAIQRGLSALPIIHSVIYEQSRLSASAGQQWMRMACLRLPKGPFLYMTRFVPPYGFCTKAGRCNDHLRTLEAAHANTEVPYGDDPRWKIGGLLGSPVFWTPGYADFRGEQPLTDMSLIQIGGVMNWGRMSLEDSNDLFNWPSKEEGQEGDHWRNVPRGTLDPAFPWYPSPAAPHPCPWCWGSRDGSKSILIKPDDPPRSDENQQTNEPCRIFLNDHPWDSNDPQLVLIRSFNRSTRGIEFFGSRLGPILWKEPCPAWHPGIQAIYYRPGIQDLGPWVIRSDSLWSPNQLGPWRS